ncbi:MAG TPA: carboxypeptidase M32 [Nitrososphaerales archaeon]|nr:carboxypeptidase M32 [Nitrososphaerales archaeon]
MNETSMFSNPLVLELNRKFTTIWALRSTGSILGWDLEVNMPPKGSTARGMVMGEVTVLVQKQLTELYPILEKAGEREGDLNDYEKGIVRVLKRAQKYFTRIPPSLLERENQLAAEAFVIWRDARKKSDFKAFLPSLEKFVELKREEADKLGYEDHPYNALLDQYEEGLTVTDVDRMYSKLIPALKKIFAKVQNSKFTGDSPLVEKSYGVPALSEVNRRLVDILGMPRERFRVDLSAHPFEASISRDDVRITTRYEGTDFRRALFSTIHESGHAIYELQLEEKLQFTPTGVAASNGFHESQSRFWENIVGRSRGFVNLLGPILREQLDFVAPYDDEQLFYYFNLVKPGLIRVDADELTYNFHTALRYELEKKVIAGEISASELPEIWDDTLEEYLGIRPPNDAMGVLQDVHWSHGDFGYFPTYTLGNVIGGMLWYNIRKDLSFEEKVRAGAFDPVKKWLYEKIHRWGATYSPKELAERSFGEPANPDRLVDYLERKYVQD